MLSGSHGWRAPAPGDPAELANRFAAAAAVWWPGPGAPRLWVEAVPAPAGSPMGERRRRIELSRPVALLRAVLLSYLDGDAELILVADRRAVDIASLALIADVTLGLAPIPDGPAPALGPPPAARRSGGTEPGFDWAAGDPGAGDRAGVIRSPFADGPADELVAAVAVVLDRYDGERAPVTAIMREGPDRNRVPGPFAVTVVDGRAESAPAPDDRPRAAVLTGEVDARYQPGPVPSFPLTVLVRRDGGERWLELHHREQSVDAGSARRFARHLVRAYAELCRGVDPRDVKLLDAAECAEVAALGETDGPVVGVAHLDELFARQVALRPDAVALSCGADSLTYRELDERATRFAGALRSAGAVAGSRVGICLERSVDLVVTMLAAVRAGAVYVPMDPAYPRARLEYTAQDAGLRLVVAAPGTLDDADVPRVLRPDDLAAEEAAPFTPSRDPGSAAYVIYTSGSTGRPKGVVIPHHNVAALIEATRMDLGLGPADVWTFFHSGAFDFSVWEIWGALLTGGRLVVVPYWTSRSVEDFHSLLVDEQVTVLNQTPSAFAQLIAEDRRRDRPLAVRLVVFGGEPLDTRLLLGWYDRYPESRCRVVNMFGITETTVHVTTRTVGRGDALAGSRSVGRALPGWSVRVVDERGWLQPIGVPGEICVGGEGVATGYLDRPDLTAQRFVPDPWTGGRMYRSGDRGRLLPDGSLEHLGRLDTQVKIRGFRIELDEIRSVLLADPAVLAAAVVLGGLGTGDAAQPRLDGYVVLGGEDTAVVRRRAARILPDHMMPATLTALDSLPLTVNGKLDRDRLPAPAATRSSPPGRPVPDGRSGVDGGGVDLAGALAEVWQDVLGVPVDGADNFFELGGNSLYAVRIASLMRERGLPRLPLRDLYRHPTVGDLAARLASAGTA